MATKDECNVCRKSINSDQIISCAICKSGELCKSCSGGVEELNFEEWIHRISNICVKCKKNRMSWLR